jgi:hypothetical protein
MYQYISVEDRWDKGILSPGSWQGGMRPLFNGKEVPEGEVGAPHSSGEIPSRCA